jgi:hypothetical protein
MNVGSVRALPIAAFRCSVTGSGMLSRTNFAYRPCPVTAPAVSFAFLAASSAHWPSGVIADRVASAPLPSQSACDAAIAEAIRWSIRKISASVSFQASSAGRETAAPGPWWTVA